MRIQTADRQGHVTVNLLNNRSFGEFLLICRDSGSLTRAAAIKSFILLFVGFFLNQ